MEGRPKVAFSTYIKKFSLFLILFILSSSNSPCLSQGESSLPERIISKTKAPRQQQQEEPTGYPKTEGYGKWEAPPGYGKKDIWQISKLNITANTLIIGKWGYIFLVIETLVSTFYWFSAFPASPLASVLEMSKTGFPWFCCASKHAIKMKQINKNELRWAWMKINWLIENVAYFVKEWVVCWDTAVSLPGLLCVYAPFCQCSHWPLMQHCAHC